MLRRLRILLLLLLLLTPILSNAEKITETVEQESAPGYQVLPEQDQRQFIVYSSYAGNTTVSGVTPNTFQITWYGEYDKVVNGWWCPQFWDPHCDPVNYRYRVTTKTYYFLWMPPQVIEVNNTTILLSFFASMNVIPYASKTLWGQMEEHVKIIFNIYAYGRIDKVPENYTIINLTKALTDIMGVKYFSAYYNVEVERYEPQDDQKQYSITGTFDFFVTDLEIDLYRLVVRRVEPIGTGQVYTEANLSEKGYMLIAPRGIIFTSLCLYGKPGYILQGILEYRNQYGAWNTTVQLTSGETEWTACTFSQIYNVVLIPGEYKDPNYFAMIFKSGTNYIPLYGEGEVRGLLAYTSLPLLFLSKTENGDLVGELYAGVQVIKYMSRTSISLKAEADITIKTESTEYYFTMSCPLRTFRTTSLYKCTNTLSNLDIDLAKISSSYADVTLTMKYLLYTVSDTARINITVLSPFSSAGLVLSLYTVLSNIVTIVTTGVVVLFAINYILNIYGRSFINQELLMRTLISILIIAVLVNGIPYFNYLFLKLVYSIPEFSNALTGTPLTSPEQILRMPPDRAFATMMSYYDVLLNNVKADYTLWIEHSIARIILRLVLLGAVVLGLIAMSVILMVTLNSAATASLIPPIVSVITTIISMLIFITPFYVIVQVLVAVVSFIVTVTTILFILLVYISIPFALIPSRLYTYFEQIMGATILFMITIPPLGPTFYALYKHVLDNMKFIIEQATSSISIPYLPVLGINVIEAGLPLEEILRIVSYTSASTIILLTVALTFAYILTRTTVMVGIGEAINRVVRR